MTEEEMQDRLEDEDNEGAPEGDAAPAPKKASKEPEISADNDPIFREGDEIPQAGFLSRLNPLRIFKGQSAENFVREGREHLENGSMAQATVSFKKALQTDPNNSSAYRGLGKVYFKKGGRSNMETALKYYQEGVKRNPKDYECYVITAKIYDALGKRKEATLERKKYVIVRALDADDKNPIANNNMGILSMQQGKTDEALEYFKKAVRSDKNFDVAYRNIAATYHRMAKNESNQSKKKEYLKKAGDEVEKALKIAETPATLLAHARIIMMHGDYEKALFVAEKVDKLAPANKDVFFLKKMALEGLGRFEEAKDAENSYKIFMQEESAVKDEDLG